MRGMRGMGVKGILYSLAVCSFCISHLLLSSIFPSLDSCLMIRRISNFPPSLIYMESQIK